MLKLGQFPSSVPFLLALHTILLSHFLPPFSLALGPGQSLGQFLLLTDFHIDQKYVINGVRTKMCHREGNESPKGQSQLGPFGDRKCDAPQALVEFMLEEAKRHIPNPEYVIWTGDSVAHVDYTEKEFLKTMESATYMIRKRFPTQMVIPVLGNHDLEPPNSFPEDGPTVYDAIFDLWKGWIGQQAKETFLKGGYYRFKSPLDASDFLVLNTNIYYVYNEAMANFSHPDDPTGQFAFLEKELEEAKARNASVHILAHMPPGAFQWDSFGPKLAAVMPRKYNQRLVELLVEYAQWTNWMLYGHFHTDTFRIVKDSGGNPVQRIFLNPAVTPMFELNNPAFRIFHYNTTNLDIVDIKTYYVDLDQLNQEGPVKIHAKLEYSMREAYGLESLDAVALNGLVERMASNDSLFREYVGYNRVMMTLPPNATKPDKRLHLCVLENVDLDALDKCIIPNNGGSSQQAIISGIFSFFGPLFISSISFPLLFRI